MNQLLTQIAQSLVDRPQDVRVNAIEGDHTTVLELCVAKEDIGKVIGRQGRTAQAMRTLIGAVSAKIKRRTVLEIVE
ncbi:KH domain-containing protein [Desulfosarcina sp.]|uniref:KH domain-containing protein n=1 Tax=Desulfosarcina sp. TaxID=2027861 RepID=UPI003970896F